MQTAQKPDNSYDSFAVAVIKKGIIVGHASQEIPQESTGNSIICRVTDKCQDFRKGVGSAMHLRVCWQDEDKLIRTFL